MKLDDYRDLEVLHQGLRTTILRGRRVDDGRPAVLKQLRTPFPSAVELRRLRREFDLTRIAAGPGVVAMHALHEGDGTAWIEMEDCARPSLHALLGGGPRPVAETLDLACRLVRVLDQIHRAGVVHKDVNPANVLVDAASGDVKLIDFGIATTVPQAVALRVDRLEGTPHYLSPEQTGRMNRLLDWRADYYALGATLYHLLTGVPPFTGSDPLELAHAHIAQTPLPPHERNAAVPVALSRIVTTLLAKRAEDRYQSARGLLHDLERCRHAGAVSFPLRAADRTDTLHVPDALYGRAAQVEQLEATIARVAGGGCEACFVTGPAGVGKTSLVGEVRRGAALHRATFLAGKFEPFQGDVPYSAVLHALRDLVHQVLGLAPEAADRWRDLLRHGLGDTGAALVEALPDVALLAGQQPPLADVSAIEAENRFTDTITRVVASLASPGCPVVLLLDDLQWADRSTLAWLERLLVDPGLERVLVLGTWRENEVDESHPLTRCLSRARSLGARLEHLRLAPLGPHDVQAMLADTLGCSPSEVETLAALAHLWTGGNPFLLHRVVERLRRENLVRWEDDRWTWDVDDIARRGLGDDSADFVAGRLSELPHGTRRALEAASCLSSPFATSVLACALACDAADVRASLAPAIALGLVVPVDADWWPGQTDDVDFSFAFAHDRIQEAAHARLDAASERAISLRVGRQLLERPQADVFDTVHYLNRAVDGLTPAEHVLLGRRNAEAGRRALRSGAFSTAVPLLDLAVALLPQQAWEQHPDAARALVLDAARAASLAGSSPRMEAHLATALARAETPLQRAAALEIRALDLAGRDLIGSITVALEALAQLGAAVPAEPAMADVEAAMGRAMGALSKLGADGVVALPELDDPVAALTVRVANAIMAPAYLARPLLLPILAAEIVQQTVARGVTPAAAYGYAVAALVLTAGGALEPGRHVAQVCLRLMERFFDRGQDGRPGHVLMGHVLPFTLPLAEAVERHRQYLPRAMAAGDHEYAMWIAHLSLANAFYAGTNLERMAADLARETQAMRRLGQQAPLDCTEPFRRIVWTLTGRPAEGVSEDDAVAELVASGSRGAVYVLQTQRLLQRYLMRDLEGALTVADEGEPYADGAAVTYHQVVFRQTLALVCIELAATASDRAPWLARARDNRRLLEPLAAHAPHNHAHRLLLIDAELARVSGDVLAAVDAYDGAIEHARRQGFLHEEALANELAGRFHRSRNRLTVARAYLLEACGAWDRWGASAKLAQLQDELPDVVGRFGSGPPGSVTADSVDLDLATLSKATLAITGEVHVNALVGRILSVCTENAGATRGMLVLDRDGVPHVAASQGFSLSAEDGLPGRVIEYTLRTGFSLVLPDATTDKRFGLGAVGPRSVLAVPLLSRGRVLGLLYLENDLVSDAFPPERIRLLELLGAQAVISLENARLYSQLDDHRRTLEQRVAERTLELQTQNRRLEETLHQLRQAQEQVVAQQRLAYLGTLTAGVAHEMRNPLNFVSNFAAVSADMLQEAAEVVAALPQDGARSELEGVVGMLQDNMQKIRHHAARADGVVQSMLLHSVRSKGQRQPTDLNALVSQSADLARHSVKPDPHGLSPQLTVETDGTLPPVWVVPPDIGRAFLNLIDNALRAATDRARAEGNGFVPRVTVTTSHGDGVAVVAVKDNGRGFDAHLREQIFTPFFTTRPTGEGTGLGLSITHEIVVGQHGGRIRVDSVPGEYAEFAIELPLRE